MKCLETRRLQSGIRRRTYLLDNRSKLTTFELPASVVRAVGLRKVESLLATWRRGQARGLRAEQLRAEIAARPDWKATALAHLLGVTEARVRQIRKEHERT